MLQFQFKLGVKTQLIFQLVTTGSHWDFWRSLTSPMPLPTLDPYTTIYWLSADYYGRLLVVVRLVPTLSVRLGWCAKLASATASRGLSCVEKVIQGGLSFLC